MVQRLLPFALAAPVLLSSAARGDAVAGQLDQQVPARNYVNLRVGASSSSARPEVCMEVSPIELLGLEGCGTGSGFLHHDPDPEIAHFRAKLKLTSWNTKIGWVQPRIALGFAELQIGEDDHGFDFFGTGASGNETAGPELGASVRTLFPVYEGFELIGELAVGAAYFRHAPRLTRPHSPFQPSASFSVGFGW